MSNSVTWNFNTFVLRSSSKPTAFVIAMDMLFPSNPSISAVFWRIKLICALESRRTFAYFYKPLRPQTFAEITGSKTSDFSVLDEILALTLFSVVLWSRRWWYCSQCTPFSVAVHCFLGLQVFKLCSFPVLLRQLKQAWFSCTMLLRSS